MRNTNKKGFTIVELVIVVAVIAILAAVLIPTFSGIIDRANQSADQQAVANMNKLLAMNEKAADVDGVVEILIKEGYKGDLSTYFKDYDLAWVESENAIVLVHENKVVYPTHIAENASYAVINPMATDAGALTDGLTDGKVVFVGGDITAEGLAPETAGEYTVNLNGNTLASNNNVGSWVDGGKLVVSNGIIDTTESDSDVGVYAGVGGSVELNNVQVSAKEGTNPVQCYGGTMVLNNVTVAQTGFTTNKDENGTITVWNDSALQIVNKIEKVDGAWKFTDQSYVTVNGGVYTGDKAIQMSAPGGALTINGGTFIGTSHAIKADYNANYASQGALHTIEINGGNFTGAITIAKGVTCTVNGGTFSVNIGEVANVTIGTGHTVVDNGNGTWTVK